MSHGVCVSSQIFYTHRRALAEFRGFTPTDRNLFFLCIEIIPIGFASGALSFNGPSC